MIPALVLAGSFLILRAAGWAGVDALDNWVTPLRYALAAMFLLTASAHWGRGRQDLVRMVPAIFPAPALLVAVTGILEILGAIGLLIPYTAPAAAICLAILLVAMFPANIHAARKSLTIRGRAATSLGPRTVLQVIFVAALVAAVLSA